MLDSASSPGVQCRIRPGLAFSPIAASTTIAGTGPGIKDRPRFADGGHHPHIGKAALGDLISHRKPHTVVAAKAIADPYNDTITHLRSMVGVRKCAEHEMHGS